MSAQPKPEAPLTAYDMADEYLHLHLRGAGIEQMNAVKMMVYRKIESGTHYLKACHEGLMKVEP